jgi:hypothetical protein
MIADKYGTYAEQCRWKKGYRRPSDMQKDDVRRCRNCAHAKTSTVRKAIWCSLDSYAVAAGGQCREWQQRKES